MDNIRIEDPDWQSLRSGGADLAGNAGGGQQLGQVLSVLMAEFGGFSSPDEIAAMLSGVRQLVNAGLPVRDVADAMYGAPGVIDALRDGNPELAKEILLPRLTDSLAELRDSGVPENLLRFFSESGFGAGELASALRSMPNLRNELMQGTPASAKQQVATLHEFFRDGGRAVHDDALLMDSRPALTWNGAQGAWFEQYMNRIRTAQRHRLSAILPGDSLGVVMPVPVSEPVQTAAGSVSDWVIGSMLAIAVVLLILSRC